MFKHLIYRAYDREVVTKFEEKNVERFVPKTVKKQVNNVDIKPYEIWQLFAGRIKNKGIVPDSKLQFGAITLAPRKGFTLDSRLEEGKTYYGWKARCVERGYHNLEVLIILGELTELLSVFKAKTPTPPKKED